MRFLVAALILAGVVYGGSQLLPCAPGARGGTAIDPLRVTSGLI